MQVRMIEAGRTDEAGEEKRRNDEEERGRRGRARREEGQV